MIEFAHVVIGTGCAAACVPCGTASERSFVPAEAVRTEVASAANAWSGGPGPNVLFVGAEPFSHPELPVLVAAAVAAGYERIGLRTDAGALSMPGNAEGVLSAGVLHLQLVLTGGDGASHD